jgi:hypothetical protein
LPLLVEAEGHAAPSFLMLIGIDILNLNPAVAGCAEWPNRRIRLPWEQI